MKKKTKTKKRVDKTEITKEGKFRANKHIKGCP